MTGRIRFRDVSRFVVLFVLLFIGSVLFFHKVFGFTVYEALTFSAPRGLYAGSRIGLDNVSVGDYIVVRMPRAVARFPEGHLLLKQVKGLPGDTYEVTKDALLLHGHSYPIHHGFEKEGIPYMKEGEFVLGDNEYLFLNLPSDSFDCRYLGPLGKEVMVARTVRVVNYEVLLDSCNRLKRWWGRWFSGN